MMMKSFVTVVITCLAAFCASQSLSNLPQCAGNCVGTSISTTGCAQLDISCICKSSGWIAGLSCCISKNCSLADQQATIQFADSFCKADGVTLPSSATCAASLSTTATGSGLSSGASTASPATSSSGVSSVTGTAGSTKSLSGTAATASTGSTASTVSAASASRASSASSAASAASVASATPSAGAVSNFVDSGLSVAGVAVAALALL